MTRELLDAQIPWWGLVLMAVGLILVGEVGFRVGRRHRGESLETKKSQTAILAAALLALLGLLLAFSFSIVEARYSARKALVLEEANAIGTTYLRAEMLPAPERERSEKLLHDYVDVRVGPRTAAALEQAIVKSEQLHELLWAQAVAAASKNPESVITAIYIQSLNDMIDLHESRVTVGLYQRLPMTILMTLYLVSVLSLGVLGFTSGLARWRSLFPTATLVIAISSVIGLIIALDNPRGRLFKVNQHALDDVKQTLDKEYRVDAHAASMIRTHHRPTD